MVRKVKSKSKAAGKKLAKDVGKVSAELKQVPEEFNKGMEVGTKELEQRQGAAPPPTPPSDDSSGAA